VSQLHSWATVTVLIDRLIDLNLLTYLQYCHRVNLSVAADCEIATLTKKSTAILHSDHTLTLNPCKKRARGFTCSF